MSDLEDIRDRGIARVYTRVATSPPSLACRAFETNRMKNALKRRLRVWSELCSHPDPQKGWTVVLRYNVVAPYDQWGSLAVRVELPDHET
jgi:hypothetical protein